LHNDRDRAVHARRRVRVKRATQRSQTNGESTETFDYFCLLCVLRLLRVLCVALFLSSLACCALLVLAGEFVVSRVAGALVVAKVDLSRTLFDEFLPGLEKLRLLRAIDKRPTAADVIHSQTVFVFFTMIGAEEGTGHFLELCWAVGRKRLRCSDKERDKK